MLTLAMRKAAFYQPGDVRIPYNGAVRFRTSIMPASLQTLILLTCSNVFMTFAWYTHLKDMNNKPKKNTTNTNKKNTQNKKQQQKPANRIGYTVMSLPQLKIMQE